MSEKTPKIRIAEDGPLLVSGSCEVVGPDGKWLETRQRFALCRCGRSSAKPYCDSTHVTIGFGGERTSDGKWNRRKDYEGRNITIHDNRAVCSHAARCVGELEAVFSLQQRPWINADGAPVEEVKQAVRRCPSGALSYSIDGVEYRDPAKGRKPVIRVIEDGPYDIEGGIELADVEMGLGASREHYSLCRCGASKNKPFCDGSHRAVEFDDS